MDQGINSLIIYRRQGMLRCLHRHRRRIKTWISFCRLTRENEWVALSISWRFEVLHLFNDRPQIREASSICNTESTQAAPKLMILKVTIGKVKLLVCTRIPSQPIMKNLKVKNQLI